MSDEQNKEKEEPKSGWSHLIPDYANGEADPLDNVYVYG
jgi:hypothetical protein